VRNVEPSLTTAEAEAAAPKMKRISRWTTEFPIGPKNGNGANIWIPADDIDGYVVAPGEWFDFWEAVGPVTRERGYKTGAAIINGRTEPQGALAGGICSCSTTLFNAALRAGFEMGDRRNHYYYINRYPVGLDATVFKSSSGSTQTMSWRNDTDFPVLIRGYRLRDGGTGYVRFDLWSVPNGRQVALSDPTIRNVSQATDSTEYTAELPAGTSERIEFPVDGMDVWVSRTVRDANGAVLHEDTFVSHYATITGIVRVGTG
jgi:vancomycin resistance protein YoaR